MLSRNLLCTNFVIQPRNWLSLCIFKNVDPVIKLNPDTKPSVPLGATVTFELPENLELLHNGTQQDVEMIQVVW